MEAHQLGARVTRFRQRLRLSITKLANRSGIAGCAAGTAA